MCNELGRMINGLNQIKGKQVMVFIPYKDIPQHRHLTYLNPVCDIQPNKNEVYRVRLVIGGDQIYYPYNPYTLTTDLTTIKIHWNSVFHNAKS